MKNISTYLYCSMVTCKYYLHFLLLAMQCRGCQVYVLQCEKEIIIICIIYIKQRKKIVCQIIKLLINRCLLPINVNTWHLDFKPFMIVLLKFFLTLFANFISSGMYSRKLLLQTKIEKVQTFNLTKHNLAKTILNCKGLVV